MEFVNFADWPHKYLDANIFTNTNLDLTFHFSLSYQRTSGQTNWQTDNNCDLLVTSLLYVHRNNKYLPHVVDNMIFGIRVPDYPIILTVGTAIWDNFEICLLYVHIYNKYLPHVVDNMIFGVSAPDYPIITVGTTILGQFWNLFTLYSYKQQIFTTCCWQYDIWS